MIVSDCGSPAEGTIVTESLVVPEPGAAMIMRANPVLFGELLEPRGKRHRSTLNCIIMDNNTTEIYIK